MRLCGRMKSDGSMNAVEISYLTYDPKSVRETNSESVVTLKAIDTDGDQWFVENVPREEADDIIEAITRHGWISLSSEYLLKYVSADACDEDDTCDEDDLR